MKKERIITRTIESHEFEVMCLNITTAEVTINTYTLGKGFTDPLKTLKNIYETDETKLVSIVNETVSTKLYGMPESDFIKYATILPDRFTPEV